jgi:gluconokinase
MNEIIYPRSPREVMAGWVYLPRFIDKIRLHLADRLPADYKENFTKGFDGFWLKSAGLTAEQFIGVVQGSLTDGEVCDWVVKNVRRSEAEKAAFAEYVLKRGSEDEEVKARLRQRKADAGLAHREDIQTFVDYIDADEKRI